jgi:myo-inositol-1(or 4)-monophosphatase
VVAAQRGGGVETPRPAALSANAELDRLLWAYNLTGRPVGPTMAVIGELIDRSSVGGGAFDLGASAYHLSRVVTGQLDAFVDPGPRLLADVPGVRAAWLEVGRGQVINSSPYDVAGAIVALAEAGAVVTDARGRPLDDLPLLGSGPDFQVSVVAAASATLHDRVMEVLEQGMLRLERSGYGAPP